MPNEIKIFYPSGNSLRAIVYSSDGSEVWTSTGFQARSETPSYITLTDSGDNGLYVGDFPEDITTTGEYPVEVEESTTETTVGGQTINWNGTSVLASVSVPVQSYTDVDSADTYFSSRLHVQVWTNSTDNNKQLALNDATRIINRFDFVGYKTVSTQPNEWPRKGVILSGQTLPSDTIPGDIAMAQFEIAFALLQGVNVEREARSAGITSRGYSSVRITYDTKLTPEWLQYGIPSMVAWTYLSSYLKRNLAGGIILHRVS